jgi:hypothetical protein
VDLAADPPVLRWRGDCIQDGLAVPPEVGVQDGGVRGLVQRQAQRAVGGA